jgi:hypothetical protein
MVGNSYLGITSGLPVIRPESAGAPKEFSNSTQADVIRKMAADFPKQAGHT